MLLRKEKTVNRRRDGGVNYYRFGDSYYDGSSPLSAGQTILDTPHG